LQDQSAKLDKKQEMNGVDMLSDRRLAAEECGGKVESIKII
jgi:hypothetical protein